MPNQDDHGSALRLWRSDVIPLFPTHDTPDLRSGDTELLGKRLVRAAAACVSRSDSEDIGIGELGAPAPFAARRAPLRNPIPNIVGVRPNPQMRWLDTGRVVARVTDTHAVGDSPVMKAPRDAVGVKGFAEHHGLPVSVFYGASSKEKTPALDADASANNALPARCNLRPSRVDATLSFGFHSPPIVWGWEPSINPVGGSLFVEV